MFNFPCSLSLPHPSRHRRRLRLARYQGGHPFVLAAHKVPRQQEGHNVDGFADILSPLAQKIINSDGLMGYHGVPQMPLFVYKAVADEVSPINDTDALVERFCGVSVNINYQRNSIGGHAAEGTNGNAAATAWLDSIFDGSFASTANATGCTIENVSINVTSSQF